jgi:ribosome maturation factor RimP
VVDRDGGIDLDAVAEVSRVVSQQLDGDEDAFAGPYVLEVTSPGVDRPLTEPRHWRRASGRLVKVVVGDETITDRVTAVTDRGVQLGERDVAWAELGKGHVQVEFSRGEE